MADQDLSIVVKVQQLTDQAFRQIAGELKKLEGQAQSTGTAASKGLGGGFDVAGMKLGNLTGVVARFAGPAAIGLAIKNTIAWGDSIADLSDNSGIAIGTLLKLEHATVGTSASIGSVANAAQELSKRIGAGDSGAIAVINKLGLNLADLKSQDPGQTFIDLATAIEGIADPTEKAAANYAVFGRGAKELGGVLKNVSSGTAEVSDRMVENVRVMGEFSDRFDDMLKDLKNLGAELVGGAMKIGKWGEAWRDAWREYWSGAKAKGPTAPGRPNLAAPGLVVPGVPEDVETVLLDLKQQTEKNADANKAAAAAANELAEAQWDAASFLHAEYASRMKRAATSAELLADAQESLARQIWRPERGTLLLPSSALPGGGMTTLAGDVSGTSPGAAGPLGTFWGRLRSNLGGLQQLLGFTGLMNANNAVGSTLSGAFTGYAAGSGLSALMTSLVGASALGPAAPIGAAIGGLTGLVGKLFGPSKGAIEGKQADASIGQLQAQLLETYGSLDNIRQMGELVGVALADAWGDKNVKGLEHFKQLLGEFEAKQDRLQSALEKYGLTWEDLGEKAKQFFLLADAQELIKDFEVLSAAGVDTNKLLEKMGGSFNALVQTALRNGLTLPEAMRPMIQSLIDMGALLDDAGNKIENLDNLFAAIQPPTIDIPVRYRYEGDPYSGDEPASTGYASGGLVRRPTRALIGEGGEPEIVGPVSFMTRVLAGALRRAGAGGSDVRVIEQTFNGRVFSRMVLELGYGGAKANGLA